MFEGTKALIEEKKLKTSEKEEDPFTTEEIKKDSNSIKEDMDEFESAKKRVSYFIDKEIQKEVQRERQKRKQEIVGELVSFCKENGNEIKFIDEGSEWYPSISDVPIDQEKINLFYSEKERDLIVSSLQVFKFYLSCPCFIDSFGTDNESRRAWESEKIDNRGIAISKDTYNFYARNKITKNQYTAPLNYLDYLEGNIENSKLKEMFQNLIKNAPSEEFLFGKEGQIPEYLIKTTEEQLETVKRFELMVRAIVLLLENPPSTPEV